jgi:hypothetical protein
MPPPPRLITAILCGALLGAVVSFSSVFVDNLPERGTILQKNGKILGGDFITFYLAGRLFQEKRGALYDLSFQREYRREFLDAQGVSESPELPFVYPILVAVIFSMYGQLPFNTAFFAWSATCVILSVGALLLVAREVGLLSRKHVTVILLAIGGYAPFTMNTLMSGQLSALGVGICAGVFVSLRRCRYLLSGMIFSLSYYKPPLFLLLLVCLSLTQPYRWMVGFCGGALILGSLTLALGGWSGLMSYLSAASSYLYGRDYLPGAQLPPNQGAGLFGAMVQLFPSIGSAAFFLAFLSGLIVYSAVQAAQRESADDNRLAFVLVSVASIGCSVQCIRYDLAILLVPFFILASLFGELSRNNRVVLSAIGGGFYVELFGRQVAILGGEFNLSSLLFLLLIATLVVMVRQQDARRQTVQTSANEGAHE